jgi:glycerophosphoryl diester phosphodiesterase
VQKTKDGILVLFHDDTLKRVTGAEGSITDYTYDELSALLVQGHGLTDKIPTLEDFLSHFAHRDITFAIELKADDCEAEVADLIYEYGIENKCVVTSFDIERIRNIKAYAPTLRIGYLAKEFSEEAIEDLVEMHADEICPMGSNLTMQQVQRYHRLGFNVRAWGISDEQIMRAVYDMGADGMTVNFPDKLTTYIKERTQA